MRPRLNAAPTSTPAHSFTQKSCQVNARPHALHKLLLVWALCAGGILGALRVGERTAHSDQMADRIDTWVGLDAPPAPSPARLKDRTRGALIRALAHARHSPQAREDLYVFSADPIFREDALNDILADTRWPVGYRGDFLHALAPAVIRAGRAHHVLPSVTLAQAILESGWGRSGLSRRHYNFFGVKAGTSSQRVTLHTHEHIAGALRPRTRSFRTFTSVDDSIRHHARLLSEDRRYARARGSWRDWRAFLQKIAPRYASSPYYVDKVSQIIEQYQLDRFDTLIIRAVAQDQARAERRDAVILTADEGTVTTRQDET